jgi:RNA polymerase sigma factor (sigma-70 family)
MANEDLYDEYKTNVAAVARTIGKSYLRFTTYPDIEQELWLLIFEHADVFRAYLQTPAMAHVAFKRHAHKFCEKLRAQSLGLDDQPLLYSLAAVRELLQDCFDYESWQSFASQGDGMPRGKKIEATGDRIAMLIDVKSAVDKLREREYNIIIARYKLGYSDTQMAEMLQIAEQSVAPAVHRAVKAVCDLMNPTDAAHDYEGTRRVKTNAASRAELDNQW